jgi:SAM-dependent methyltransferase
VSPYPIEPLKKSPSTYVVQDLSNQDEMHRLEIQDMLVTTGMGGVLPELADPTSLRQVLDVGCGTGGWLIETAKAYPMIERLLGGDISDEMLDYASTKAEEQQVGGRVRFKKMDALRALEFPDASFDLVNQRLGLSWLRTWEWRKVLMEYQRVTQPGGIIRITESDLLFESNSPALTKLNNLFLQALRISGRFFTERSDGMTGELVRLMTQHNIKDVKSRLHTLVLRAGTQSGQIFSEDMARGFRTALPFIQKWTHVPNDYQETYQQALKEMQQPDFVATWTLLTAWGTRS